ncbi:hypothetical protein [Reyranella soli]|uniref:Uncharacterized protein n=1 Tax=Reyranella soli TaxID=1230389 RepID=A0A512N8V6_9HYPH|nr:hypothetical protein [Reyranella soli]GEP55353.1 hypothetical protein RSO01_25190 [Reyranella soli]
MSTLHRKTLAAAVVSLVILASPVLSQSSTAIPPPPRLSTDTIPPPPRMTGPPPIETNASAAITGSPQQAYWVIKDIISKQARFDETYIAKQDPSRLSLANCSDTHFVGSKPVEYFDPRTDPGPPPGVYRPSIEELLDGLATSSLQVEYVLSRYRLPDVLWRKALADLELDALRKIVNRDDRWVDLDRMELIERINANARMRNWQIPELDPALCGGPPGVYLVRTDPSAAQIELIPKLYFTYCERIGINPEDTISCNYWFPAIRDGQRVFLGGLYKVRLRWADRTTRVSDFDVSRLSGEEITFFERR